LPPLARAKIILRADSGFCRKLLMAWCEANQVYYTLGLRRNQRLHRKSGHRSLTRAMLEGAVLPLLLFCPM
jgi:hypothetical protein